MVKEYACKQCKMLTTGKVCPNCHSTDLTAEWSGLVIILDVKRSQVAKALNIKTPGKYALKVT